MLAIALSNVLVLSHHSLSFIASWFWKFWISIKIVEDYLLKKIICLLAPIGTSLPVGGACPGNSGFPQRVEEPHTTWYFVCKPFGFHFFR